VSDAEADDGVRGGGVMAAPTIAPYRSAAPAGNDGFGQLLRAEWTKFRTVRGWVIGLIVAGLLTAGVGLLSHSECGSQASPSAPVVVGGPSCTSPLGPTVSGSGDIAPVAGSGASSVANTQIGTFAGLIAMIVVATMFITAEYRRGLIRLTLTASPRRHRILAAKAIVIGVAAFVVGVPAAVAALLINEPLARSRGIFIDPVSALTEVRILAGTALLLAVTAVLALALGTVLRRGAATVTAVIAAIVLPYFFAVPLAVLPVGVADWLLRLTPAAGFAIQQPYPAYPQVTAN
jgi:hypothetical protein